LVAAAPGTCRTTQSPSGQACICCGPSLTAAGSCALAAAGSGRPAPPRGLRLTSSGRRRALRGLTAVSVWHPLQLASVRLVIARCSVDYAGRLSAHLPLATRLLIVKADGSVLVHSDGGSYKPLNWMSPPCRLAEGDGRWVVTGKSGETLTIDIDEVISDSSFDLGIDPGLRKDGVESHLQELLAAQMDVLGEGWRLVRREFPTPIGPVDLMCRDALGVSVAIEVKRRGEIDGSNSDEGAASRRGAHVAVEVKRHAGIDAVEQLTRYLELLNRDPLLAPVKGVLAAQTIKPQARTLAEDRGIRCVVLDYDAMRGIEHEGTLF
jgi:RecB family endonuclease NucS